MEPCSQKSIVVVEDCLRLGLIRGKGEALMHERQNVTLALSVAGLEVEELGVCVTVPQVTIPRLLPCNSPGQ
jgi:hypothetical protein